MTLATMANDLLMYAPGLNPDILKSVIQDTYRQLCSKDWGKLKLIRSFPTVIPYSTGTIAVDAAGTVTGVLTVFTSAMVGRWLRVYYADSMFEIDTVTPPLSLTLKDWPGTTIVAGTSYYIFKTIYDMNSQFGEIHDIIYQVPLTKKSQSYFNKLDPGRVSTSSSPIYWALAGVTSAGVIQVEIYPPPSDVITLRVEGKRKAATLADGDAPYLPEDLIVARALIDCYELKELQQPNQGWAKKKGDQTVAYNDLLQMYEEEDYRLGAFPDKVKDKFGEASFPSDDNFALSHDVEW